MAGNHSAGKSCAAVRRTCIALLGVTLFGIAPVYAQDGFGGAVTLVSDYIYRGVSQSRGEPALQADLHYASAQGWSLGIWGSNVELNNWEGQTVELNAYAAYRWQLSRDWSAKVSAVHYEYPWNNGNIRYDYNEVLGTVSFQNTLFATVAWSLDASRYGAGGYLTRKHTVSYEVAAALPLVKSVSANVGVGYFDLNNPTDNGYFYWNAGLSYDWRSWRADLGYIGTEHRAQRMSYGHSAGDRLTAGLSWRF